MALRAGVLAYLVGPAGSGKTTLARQAATALKRDFYAISCCAQTPAVDFFGYTDINGRYVETQFFKAFTQGGLFLFDEFDACNPNTVTAVNAAIDNRFAVFGGKRYTAHANFICIAAGNTNGRGADYLYTGRNVLDAATLSRFGYMPEIGYNAEIEKKLAGKHVQWLARCYELRAAAERARAAIMITPRTIRDGARLLDAGMAMEDVERVCIWKGCADEVKRAVLLANGEE